MAQDLVVKLKADNKDLKKGLAESQKEIQRLRGEVEKAKSGMGDMGQSFGKIGTLAKAGFLAAGAGAAMFAKEVLAAGAQTQSFGDALVATQDGLKAVKQAVLGGIFTGISTDITQVYNAAKELSLALDNLATAQMWGSGFQTQISTTNKMLKVDFTNALNEVRKARKEGDQEAMNFHLNRVKEIQAEIQANIDLSSTIQGRIAQQAKASNIAAKNNLLASVGLSEADIKATGQDLDYILRETYMPAIDDLGNNMNTSFDNALAIFKKFGAKAIKEALKQEGQMVNVSQGLRSSGGGQFGSTVVVAENTMLRRDMLQTALVYGSLSDATDENQKHLVNSIKAYYQTADAMASMKQEAAGLESSLIRYSDSGNTGGKAKSLPMLPADFKTNTLTSGLSTVGSEIDKLTGKTALLNDQFFKLANMNLESISDAITKKGAIEYQDQLNAKLEKTNGLMGIAGAAQQALSQIQSDKTGVNNVISGMNAIMSVIPQLITAEGALAIASGTKSAAGMPFPYNLIAMGLSVAGVVAALATKPPSVGRFANGGIVAGNSYSGDRVPAMVNSGEMILNHGQQSNLFSMINSGTGGRNGGNVRFEIEGSKLVGVLNNHTRKMS